MVAGFGRAQKNVTETRVKIEPDHKRSGGKAGRSPRLVSVAVSSAVAARLAPSIFRDDHLGYHGARQIPRLGQLQPARIGRTSKQEQGSAGDR